MAVTVPGGSGVPARSRAVVELVPDLAHAPTLLLSMAVTTAQSWDRVQRVKAAAITAAKVETFMCSNVGGLVYCTNFAEAKRFHECSYHRIPCTDYNIR